MYKVAPRSVNTSESPATIIQASNLTEQKYNAIFYTILIDLLSIRKNLKGHVWFTTIPLKPIISLWKLIKFKRDPEELCYKNNEGSLTQFRPVIFLNPILISLLLFLILHIFQNIQGVQKT